MNKYLHSFVNNLNTSSQIIPKNLSLFKIKSLQIAKNIWISKPLITQIQRESDKNNERVFIDQKNKETKDIGFDKEQIL